MAQIEKQQFRNDTQGWIGAVVINPKGEERGIAVEAGGTIWLSEAEQILTANAPRRPEDNPFLEQKFSYTDPVTNEPTIVRVTPLTPISERRFVPASERYIPDPGASVPATQAAAQAARGDEPVVVTVEQNDAFSREQQILDAGKDARPGQPPPPAPARARAAAAAMGFPAQTAEGAAEAPQPPPAPSAPTPPGADAKRKAPADEGRVSEETAQESPGPQAEETGAAVKPSGSAPTGRFKSGEEVGSPEAPAQQKNPPPFNAGG